MRRSMLILLIWSLIGPVFAATECERQCLIDIMDGYIGALVRHDPSAAPLGTRLKTVENLQSIEPGEGLWKSLSAGPTSFRIVVPDPLSQRVGAIVMMQENERPIEVALRLQLDEGRIIRADHIVARNIAADYLQNLVTPRPVLLSSVPEDSRMSREEMLRIAAEYYQALAQADGSLAPFAADCVRRESGWQSTSNPPPESPPVPEPGEPLHRDLAFQILSSYGCAAQLDTKIFANISKIDDRRIDIADPQTGLVFAFSHFHHEFKQRVFKLVGVPGVDAVDWDLDPFDLYAAHIFRITGGKIHEIEANGAAAPYNSPTVW